jgi:poly-gamma-glutamate synthesis protein (capsule biosynthesis protein)
MIDPRVSVLDIDGVNPLLASATNEEPVISIGVAGDIIFGRNGGNRQRAYGDYNLPMYQVKDFLSTFDLTVANFECFVSTTMEPPELTDPKTLDFVTPPDSLQGMVMSGIDSVTMANNHAFYPFGEAAMNDTIGFLNEAGISTWGVGSNLDEARTAWTTEVNGLSIAFYGVDGVTANIDYPGSWALDNEISKSAATDSKAGTNPLIMDNILADIERLAGEHDIVLPYFHAGEQYVWTPREWLVNVSRELIDAGASAMLTSHPHATMGMEIYKGKPIFYSIGNFVYDQMFTVETRQGYVIDLTFRGKNVVNYRIHPTEVLDFVQPRLMSSSEKTSFWDRHWRSIDMIRSSFDYTPAP